MRKTPLARPPHLPARRVRDALAAGSTTSHEADQLATLLSAVSLQQQEQQQQPRDAGGRDVGGGGDAAAGMDVDEQQQQQQRWDARQQEEALASAAGSSYTCARCGGVVSCARREAHQAAWCESID